MIILDNFINMIRISVFDENVPIEPMSPWKWRQLKALSTRHGVNAVMQNVIDLHGVDTTLNIPSALLPISGSKADYANIDNLNISRADIDYLCTILTQNRGAASLDSTVLATGYKQKCLDRIREEENASPDKSVETLRLLDIIIANVTMIEQQGFSLLYILALGHFLRTMGHKVDFVKLESWIRELGFVKLFSLLASILVHTFGFEKDEIPFVFRDYKDADKGFRNFLMLEKPKGRLAHTTAILQYAPMSFVSYWTTLTHDSLTKIEE